MKVFEKETFPLRLICIEETLASEGGICYCECRDWSFHIISHTWTKDLRDWSEQICNMMQIAPEDDQKQSSLELLDKAPVVHDRYAELFKQHSFAKKKGYGEFVEFLNILAADGVERVWFDALCINQGDVREKDREIAHMGAYYACSAGCYVWCHGVGSGFRLWAPAAPPGFFKLPRWFSRVWTLQELVLPSKLAFIVGMDMEGFTAYFAYKAFCRFAKLAWCPEEFMDDSVKAKFGPQFELSSHLLNSKKLFPCPHCGHQKINDTRGNKGGELSQPAYFGHVYYVERLKYLDLIMKSSFKSVANYRIPPIFMANLRSQLQRLPSMLSIHGGYDGAHNDEGQGCAGEMIVNDAKGVRGLNDDDDDDDDDDDVNDDGDVLDTFQKHDDGDAQGHDYHRKNFDGHANQRHRMQVASLAIQEISERDCSEGHDEDRLLSILGLLEIEGKVQLRTGKSLEEQTIEVAQGLLQHSMHAGAASMHSTDHDEGQSFLALLCLAQYRGNPTISMSWAPTFTKQKVMGSLGLQKLSSFMFNNFKTIAHIEGVSSLGLRLHCPFMKGKVSPFAHHRQDCGICDLCRLYSDRRDKAMDLNHFILEVPERKHYSVYLWVYHDPDESANEVRFLGVAPRPSTCSMAIQAECSIESLLSMSLHVWLLLLAQDTLPESSSPCPYGMFLVCVGEDTGNIHKVGVCFNGPGWDPEEFEEPVSDAASYESSEGEEEEEGQDAIKNEDLQEEHPYGSELQLCMKELQKFASEEEEEEEEEEEAKEAQQKLEGELEVEVPTWKEDVEWMQRDNFTVGGFGPFVPSHLFIRLELNTLHAFSTN